VKRRELRLLLVILLLVAGAGNVLGNVPPTMDDQYVTTVQDTPVTFTLRAQDEDIDPLDPGGHPLRFVLLEGPSHGILIGDMAEVRYEGPHDAVVEMTYVPATGFAGIDLVTIAVVDPFDETASGTITIQIDVTERRAEGLLSGSWSMNATWESQSGSFTALRSQLTEVYRIGALMMKGVAGWRTASVGGVKKVVLDSLRLEGDVKLGTLSVSSTLALDPDAADPADLFDYWRTTVGFSLQGVSFRHTFYLTTPVTSSYQTLYAQRSAGGLNFTNTLRFDVNDECAFEFARNDTVIGWSWCDLNMTATFAVSCDGFQQAVFSVSDLPIPGLIPGLTLNAGLSLTVDAKTLSTTLRWRPSTSGCIRVYGGLEVGGAHDLEIQGVSIYEVRIECDIGGVKVASATSLDPAKNSRVTGQTDYFEVLRMSGTLMGCCEVPGTWGIATYFYGNSTQLFDWGMTTGAFDLALTDYVDSNLELVFRSGDLGDPKMELSFGFVVRW
jgi:hypothetical protein